MLKQQGIQTAETETIIGSADQGPNADSKRVDDIPRRVWK